MRSFKKRLLLDRYRERAWRLSPRGFRFEIYWHLVDRSFAPAVKDNL